jgi:hypothetical protein
MVVEATDLAQGDFGGADPVDFLATALPIAYELDRQVEEWYVPLFPLKPS